MSKPELENLARIGKLAKEPPTAREFAGLLASGKARLADAQREINSMESRFDLAYNASHAFALAALRWHGYRSDNRYLVFQSLPHTLGLAAPQWRILSRAHEIRNLAEYEGHLEIDAQFLVDLVVAASSLQSAALKLPSLKI